MPKSTTSTHVTETRVPSVMRGIFRAIMFGIAWSPSLALVLFVVPKFQEFWAHLAERGMLPASTEWVLTCWRTGRALFGFPFLVVFGLLLLVDAEMARRCSRSHRFSSLYRVWFAGIIAAGLLAAAFVGFAILRGMPTSTTV